MSVYDADYPFGVFKRSIKELRNAIDGLPDDGLGAFISKAETEVATDRLNSALWRLVADMGRRRMALVKARRTATGTWIAKAEAVTCLVGEVDPNSARVLEFRECDGKDAAIAVARELLAQHAGSFDHVTEVRVSVVPEIEWKAERAAAG